MRRRERGARSKGSADSESGAGTVLVLGIVAAVLLLAVGIAALGAAQNARGAAQAAADLGALAGATALRDGFDPCGTAGAAVARNGAELASCEVRGAGVVRIAATRAAVGPAGLLGSARATARAGPREAGSRESGPQSADGEGSRQRTARDKWDDVDQIRNVASLLWLVRRVR